MIILINYQMLSWLSSRKRSDLLTELERVKGLRTNVLANQLQGTERGNVFQEKNQTFQNEYARGSMINSEEAQAAMNAYNNAALAAQIENNKWQQNFASEEFAANQAQQGFQNNLATASLNKAPSGGGVSTPSYLIPGTADWARYQEYKRMGQEPAIGSIVNGVKYMGNGRYEQVGLSGQ
jgi:hypothetical protein